MRNTYFNIDYEKAYPKPTPERIAEAFFNRMWRKLHVENFSYLIVLYGLHRVGKSEAAVSIAHILDETFEENLESRVVYNSRELLNTFKDIRVLGEKGCAVVVDEAGSGDIAATRWYEDMAKIVSAQLQAVGWLNPLILFVTQNYSFINSTARKLSSGVFEVERKNNRYSTIKPFWVQSNPWMTGSYRKYPIFCEERNGILSNVYKVNRIKIVRPPLEIRKRYENHSQAYKDKFLHESEEEIALMDSVKSQKNLLVSGIEDIAGKVFSDTDKYRSYKKNKTVGVINEDLIRHEFNLTNRDARLVKLLVEKKIAKSDTENS